MVNQDFVTELSSRLRAVLEKHRVLRAILFGSLARGEVSRHSDVDLLVIQDTDRRFLDRYDGLLRDVAALVPGRDVDLLIYTPEEMERFSHRPLIATALREGKVIYESEQEPIPG